MSELFGKDSYYRDTTAPVIPNRAPDLVVINLGGNDNGKKVSVAEYKEGAIDLINQIRQTWGKSMPIIMMYKSAYVTAIQEIITSFGEGVYMCELTGNKDGGNGHPSAAAHQVNAEELYKFISDNNILK